MGTKNIRVIPFDMKYLADYHRTAQNLECGSLIMNPAPGAGSSIDHEYFLLGEW